jgi:ketosteroid isomerase-like protein
MRNLLLLSFIAFLLPMVTLAQSADEKAVRQILHEQTEAWNKGDLVTFMKGYWENDSLMFVGKNGVTYGYQNTLNNYKKNYNGPDQMGTLTFNLIKVDQISKDYFFVVGKWNLKRNAGDISGHYNLLFRKIKGKWVIVADHSS